MKISNFSKIYTFLAINLICNNLVIFAQKINKINAASSTTKITKSSFDIISHLSTYSAQNSPELVIKIPPQVSFMISTLGLGGIAGLCVGYTLKKFAKIVAIILGVLFIVLQILAYMRFITVNWDYINSFIAPSGLQTLWISLISIITYNFPFAGAFITGMYVGFNKG